LAGERRRRQLARGHALTAERLRTIRAALDRADAGNAATAVQELDAIAGQVEREAGTKSGVDAKRLQLLAATLKARAARLRS
jgi:hypothetical protein